MLQVVLAVRVQHNFVDAIKSVALTLALALPRQFS